MRKKRADDPSPDPAPGRRLAGIMGVIALAFLLHIALSHSNLREAEVNGPIYQRVIQNKDLIAETLPPPLYIIESYNLTLEMLQNRDAARLAALEARLRQLEATFGESHRAWRKRYRGVPPIVAALDRSSDSGRAFYALAETRFLPLVEKGDYEPARLLADGEMRRQYGLHRADIDGLVAQAEEENDREQRHAVEAIARRTWLQSAWEAVTVLLILVPAIWIFRTEKRLRRTETHLRAIFENGSDLIFGVSVEAGGVFRYNMMNPAGARLGGIDVKRFIGSTPAGYFPPEKAARFEANYRRCVETGEIVRYEQATQTSDTAIVFDTTLLPSRDGAGRVTQIMGISRNVTAQKSTLDAMQRLNAQLEDRVAARTREMETAYRELEMFSYSVSHDLRSPLRGVNGFCAALIEDYGSKLDPEARGYLDRIDSASRRMGQIIDDLLELSKVSRSKLVLQPVDLSLLAARIADDLRASAPGRSASFAIAPGLSAQCDFRLMQSVLENLLGNAWKYSGRKPDARIEFDSVEREGQTAFRVRDNGAGFDMRFVEKLFQNFQRLHDRTEFEGTGIGLAIVARIIRRHGGRVWAEGAVGEGASFYFTLGEEKKPRQESPAIL